MTKHDDTNSRSVHGLRRRSLLGSTAALLSTPLIAWATKARAQDKLAGNGQVVIYSYGGSFTQNVRKYVYEPLTKATGIKVVDVTADFAEPQVKAMNQAGRVDWDVANIQAFNYPGMHEAGMFLPIDYSLWDAESLQGVPESDRRKDAVVIFQSAQLLAYDERAYPKGGPKNWVDFWDIKKFPGPRGLYAPLGKYDIPFALVADGVAHGDVWPLTDDKLDRAFRKLDGIKPHITKWWSAGGESPQLLINREYAASSAYDGRTFSVLRQGAPIKFSWEGAYQNQTFVTALKGAPNAANAQKFLAFLNRAEIAAAFTQATGYPSPNVNQLKYLPPELIPQVSINPENASKVVREDSDWLAAKRSDGKTNADHVQERWLAWRAR